MATRSSTLAWEIPWTEPGGLQSIESQESDMTVTKQQIVFQIETSAKRRRSENLRRQILVLSDKYRAGSKCRIIVAQ